ncbi:MAG TPA: hypothetical protein VES65_05250, partial [Solirubrobacteraceae bacterium]|nr:hypothetical protein [Solirubrobacteraceae bacterium]
MRQTAAGLPPLRFGLLVAALLLLAAGILVAILVGSQAPAGNSQAHAKRSRTSPAAAQSAKSTLPSCGARCDPIDPRYLTGVPFGRSSFWIQPWRAYLDTWPASRLLDSLGVNFDVKASAAHDVARLLHDSGFRLARVGINWSALSYSDPTKFTNESAIRTRLVALHDYGLRPLILLDANSVAPCPTKKVVLDTVTSAPAGATSVTLTASSAAEVLPGKTGFDSAVFNPSKGTHRHRGARAKTAVKLSPAQRRERREARRAAAGAGLTRLVLQGNPGILITKVSASHVASLSRPLPLALPAGEHKGTTLLYAPFGPPKLPDGSDNPAFQATLRGWLSYVATVSKLAQGIFGPDGYDLEVWNELTFGSQFLDSENYYTPAGQGSRRTVTREVTKTLLNETVAYVRSPAHGIGSGVGITNGFADQTPFTSGAHSPAGLTALSKHLYTGVKSFPSEFHVTHGNVPLDALGERDTVGPHGSAGSLTPLFVPRYQSLFPEYYLTAVQTATIVRDLAPITTDIHGVPHGRHVSAHGSAPQVWMTEYNLGTRSATPVGPDEVTPESSAQLTAADKAHFQAKALLRSLVAMVNKGMTREYFFHAAPGPLSLISESFSSTLAAHPNTYPGDQFGGETMTGLHNML